MTVLVLAAGLGTRMKSRTAKVLHRTGGRALIEHVLLAARQIAPPDRVFVVVGHQAKQVEEVLLPYGVGTITQTEQKGTGHALMTGRDVLEPLPGFLLVLYGDCPLISVATLKHLVETHRRVGSAATVVTTTLADPAGYGRVIQDETGRITAIVEQKAGTPEQLSVREINSGIYCFDASLVWEHIQEIRPDNPAGEYYLTDIVEILNRAGHRVQALHVEDSSEVLGINNRVELAEVDRICRERKVRQLMIGGVTIEKPETVTVDGQVEIGIDSVVGPFTQLLGNTVIGENCRIGACSIIENSSLEANVEVGPFTMIGRSRIERGARVGPYARLRFDNHVERGAQIGNFVELKKTRLGPNAKAMHLAYLGDSNIGEDVNIGAGTITCNYDGVKKHLTEVGRGSFVGSNSTLVAPLAIGEGAYVGAGSVITSTVPDDALALGRARQVVKEGWAKKRKEKK